MIGYSNNWMSGLLVPDKPWEQRTAFGAENLLNLWEALPTLHSKYEGPNFYFGYPLYTPPPPKKKKTKIFY